MNFPLDHDVCDNDVVKINIGKDKFLKIDWQKK